LQEHYVIDRCQLRSGGFRDGVCTIRFSPRHGQGDKAPAYHTLQITSGGQKLSIDGKFDFDLTDKKKYIVIGANHVPREVNIR